MADHREAGVVAVHAGAVVGDADEVDAALFEVDTDAARAGVEGVLDQLLDDAGGALDDLSGGDLVGQILRQDLDPARLAQRAFHGRSERFEAREEARHVQMYVERWRPTHRTAQ